MKTEYKKVSDFLALEDAEVIKEFEMVELKGGLALSSYGSDIQCVYVDYQCGIGCPCNTGGICFSK